MAAPVDRRSLAHLAEISYDSANKALVSLHSIVAIPDNITMPIQLHHASFCEFIMDLSRCNDPRFSVDRKWQHKILAGRCVQLVTEHLRQDICDLRAPGVEVARLDRSVVKRLLSPSVEYACRFWLPHVEQADEMFDDLSSISMFLHRHLLHWFEALSLLRRSPEAVHVLGCLEMLTVSCGKLPVQQLSRTMLTNYKRGEPADLQAFVHDAKRFALAYAGMMAKTPLQIYSSALVFTPSRSIVRRQFLH